MGGWEEGGMEGKGRTCGWRVLICPVALSRVGEVVGGLGLGLAAEVRDGSGCESLGVGEGEGGEVGR